MGLMDFLSPEAGQARRRWLEDTLSYYIPPELAGPLGLLQMANPVAGVERASGASQDMLAPDATAGERLRAGGDMALELAGIVGPAAAMRYAGRPAAEALQEGLLGWSPSMEVAGDAARAVGRDIIDRLNQPGPMPTLYSNPVMRAADDVAAPPGIKAYHGSPYDFDRFSMGKIGTGEGAQAYGHGLYFAENEGVARAYRDALARPYYVTDDGVNVAEKYGADVVDAFENVGGDPEEITATINRLRSAVQRNLADFGVRDVSELQPEYAGDLASSTIDMARRAEGLSALLKSADVRRVNEGRMYEVNIRANPDDFLDWDAPLSEQSAKVLEAINRIAPPKVFHSRLGNEYRAYLEGPGGIASSFSGATRDEALEKAMQGLTGENIIRSNVPTMISKELREAGIPGIKYLDSGSRGMGEGTRNYVVFDENLINIVRKYGIAGAAALLGVSAADVEQAMAQGRPQPQGLLSMGAQ